MELRNASPGDLGGPVFDGLELREVGEALSGVFTDMDEGTRQVKVEFPHERVDTYQTVFGKDAFRDSFEARPPVMCWQHDLREPIGRSIRAQALPTHNEIIGQFDDFDAVPLARRAFTQIDSGTIRDFSFGFKGAKYEPAGELGKGVRRIKSAFMAEFSPVTIGSIPGAKATGLREDSGLVVMELAEIMQLRDTGVITDEGAKALVAEHYPNLREHINLRDIKGNDGDADDNSGSAGEDMVAPVEWTALDSGTHTATGPNDEILRAASDGKWHVTDSNGDKVAEGEAESQDDAKREAEEATMSRGDDEFYIPESVDADDIRAAIEESHPGLALVLRDAVIAVAPAGQVPPMPGADGGGIDPAAAAGLVAATDAALDSATQWLQGVDIAALPDPVQQALALVQAAAEAIDGAMDAMNLNDPEDDDGDGRSDDEDLDERTDDEVDAPVVDEALEAIRSEALSKLDERLASRTV